MKRTRKIFSAMAMAAALTVTAIPAVKVEAAVSPIAGYDFEDGTGMKASGISGSTAPKVVKDSERGNVLKLAEGSSSKVIAKADDQSMGDYDMRIDKGTPSSLKFKNPFKGKSLKGITISFWVKVPNDDAALNASGLIGFVSGNRTIEHPDKVYKDPTTGKVDPDKQHLPDGTGPFFFGITCACIDLFSAEENPMIYFAGLHHNSYNLNDEDGAFLDCGGKWKYMTVTMNNSDGAVYVDGEKLDLGFYKNKRWNDGEVNGGSPGNVGQPKFLEFISWSDTEAYVGYTGFSPTSEVCLDDITFYDKELSGAEVKTLFETAKKGSTVEDVSSSDSGSSDDSDDSDDSKAQAQAKAEAEAKRKAAEEAARKAAEAERKAVAANKEATKNLISSVVIKGMPSDADKSIAGIFRGDDKYEDLLKVLQNVELKKNYYMKNVIALDIDFGGKQPEGVAEISMDIPEGYDEENLVFVRVNDDETVSILKHEIKDGRVVARTNHFSQYALVELTDDKDDSQLPKTGAVAAGVVAAIGAVSVLGGTVVLKRRKEEE